MTSFLIALALFLFFAIILVLPAFRSRLDGFRYYISGRTGAGDLELNRRMLLENLRELEIEREQGKLNAEEFQAMALPLAKGLANVEKRLGVAGAPDAGLGKPRTHRLGFTCPVCGAINHSSDPVRCEQCGSSFA